MRSSPPDRPRPHPRRAGWIPLGLTGQILLAAAVVPGAAFAPELGGAVADGARRTGEAVADRVLDVWDAAERWAASTLHLDQAPHRLRRELGP